ncbi:MAG TPA: helix-turn-helix transcriptional regulator [Streptosporangiaceae bacterium]|nr:helix-turn-helix transcriptional regulator [Streptosporangiaceae bacterium]
MTAEQPHDGQMEALGAFIRSKRKLANLSLRQLAERTRLSNPYLSQIERGLHQPSVRVIRLISDALNVSAETLLAQAGLFRHDHAGGDAGESRAVSVEDAIAAEERLSAEQKSALVAVYRSMLPAE